MKNLYTKDIKEGVIINGEFMIMKKLSHDGGILMAYIGDKTGDVKAQITDSKKILNTGDVIKVIGTKDSVLKITEFKKLNTYKSEDFLPCINKPLEEILDELKRISEEEFKSEAAKALNSYFFDNNTFIENFKKGIGGLSQHHNYRGGLAEHTLNVTHMAKVLADRYDCRYKEIAILSAKLHDIGKIIEYYTDGPFSVTLRGEMEGHIVIGITMIEEAFKAGGNIYSDDFKQRIKGCVVQHHGKVEYGSPKAPNTEEAFVVHYADYIDATFNKIGQVKDSIEPNNWSEYDKRIGTKLYF